MRIQGLHSLDHATKTAAIMLTVFAFPIVSLASRPFVTEDAEVVGNTNPDRTVESQPASAMVGTTVAISDHIVVDTSTRFGSTPVLPEWNTSLGLSITL